ncbi:MAG: isoprenyl transferase [Bacteroidota bacterium]
MARIEDVDRKRLPKHVAIIMDGNGRWAQKQGQARIYGHNNGVESVRQVTEAATELGVEYITLYAFSTENWNRPKEEVDALMNLLVKTIHGEIDTLNKNNIRLLTIGNTDKLPEECRQELMDVIQKTSSNSRLNLVLALSYSSHEEIVNAVRNIASECINGNLKPDEISDRLFSDYLYTRGIPDPELLIRTSGEQRISNFLLWQTAYAELYFSPVLWPDYRKEDFYDALVDFQQRERRFGLTSEQIKNNV